MAVIEAIVSTRGHGEFYPTVKVDVPAGDVCGDGDLAANVRPFGSYMSDKFGACESAATVTLLYNTPAGLYIAPRCLSHAADATENLNAVGTKFIVVER